MVRILRSCVVNGIEFTPDPEVLHDERCFGPYLHELRVDGSLEFAEEAAKPAATEPERKTAFGTKRK